MKAFASVSKPVLDFACSKRGDVINLIAGLTAQRSKKRKFRNFSFIEMYSGKRLRISSLAEVSGRKVKGIFESFVNGAFKMWLSSVRDTITNFIMKMAEFFKSFFLDNFVNILSCFLSGNIFKRLYNFFRYGYEAIKNIFETIKNLKKKIDILLEASKNQVLLIIAVVDYLTAMICNFDKFRAAIDLFMRAFNSGDRNERFGFYGKALGNFLYAVSNSNTYSMAEYNGIKARFSK